MRLCMFVIKARSELKKSEKTAPANNYQSNADVVNVNKKPKQDPTLPEWWDFLMLIEFRNICDSALVKCLVFSGNDFIYFHRAELQLIPKYMKNHQKYLQTYLT